jgi:hypothetical protein
VTFDGKDHGTRETKVTLGAWPEEGRKEERKEGATAGRKEGRKEGRKRGKGIHSNAPFYFSHK